ncbi:hypothetical protein [Oscillibacter sp. CU971]|uniref:hypothetical protein n=1 Tax=Oscillibacter sp. CU971 TaxID=2780102 RepID=UPI00195AE30D|nr:hypothetical protein [Oscillibacter sp. CU971]
MRDGKEYTYWEDRITTGRDPGTGKQVQRSFTGKTQREVREKLQAAAVAVNSGTYTDPSRLTVGLGTISYHLLTIFVRDRGGDIMENTFLARKANGEKILISELLAAPPSDEIMSELFPYSRNSSHF